MVATPKLCFFQFYFLVRRPVAISVATILYQSVNVLFNDISTNQKHEFLREIL